MRLVVDMDYNFAIVLVAVIALYGLVQCQNDLEQDLNKIQSNIPGLENFNQDDLPKQEEVEQAIKDKCIANGGDFEALKAAQENVKPCIEKLINVTLLMEELEEAKKSGSMDEVFGKYCRKKQDFFDCAKEITVLTEKCLEEDERAQLTVAMNTTDSLIDFLCFKNGDRLALFVAEGGLECLDQRKEGMQRCLNSTLAGRTASQFSVESLPKLVIGEKECRELDKLQECISQELEQCADNTPANLADAFFKYIRKLPVCASVTKVTASHSKDGRIFKRQSNDQFHSVDSGIIAILQNKCNKHANLSPSYVKQVQVKYETCYNTSVFGRKPEELGPCTYLEAPTWKCVVDYLNDFKRCFNIDEAYVNEFAETALNGSLHYLCDNSLANYHKFFRSFSSRCVVGNSEQILHQCVYANTIKTNDNGEIIWKKDHLCEKLSNMDDCVHKYTRDNCAADDTLNQFTREIFLAVRAPCMDSTQQKLQKGGSQSLTSNSLSLFVTVIFVQYFYRWYY